MASTNDLKNGMVLNIDGQLWAVVEFQHVKPGKGPAFVRTKLKNVESNKTVDKTFNAGTKVETATVDRRTMQYLYNDGTSYVFMDTGTYDQLEIAPEIVGDAEELPAREPGGRSSPTNDGRVLFIELPASVELRHQLHRARPRRRQRHRSHQAGHARDRSRDPGAAVHQPGREGQGRHPRLAPTWVASSPDVGPRPRPASGRSTCSSPPSCAVRGRRRGARPCGRRGRAARPTTTPSRSCAASPSTAPRIDELLATYSEGWTLERMPAVDRNVLRLGVYELLYVDDVPDAVAVSEAMTLVRDLSTDESPAFVNGVLGAVQRNKAAILG